MMRMAGKRRAMIFHTPGGRVPLTLLRRMAELGLVHGNGCLGFGSRQELILPGIASEDRNRVRQAISTLLPEHHPRRPNIVTTRAATGRSHRTPWLSEGAYDHVLDTFTTPPSIPVNLVDPCQSSLPHFTGQLHFVATAQPDYWRIAINTGSPPRPTWFAAAVCGSDLAPLTRLIQQALLDPDGLDLPGLQASLEAAVGPRMLEVEAPPPAAPEDSRPLTDFVLDPESGDYTLGIPAQRVPLPCQFLVDLAVLSRRLAIGTAYVTPWKSLLLHGIRREQRMAFEKLLLRHRVSVYPGGWDTVCFNDFHSEPCRIAGNALLRTLNETAPHPGDLRLGLVECEGIAPDTPIVVRAEVPTRRRWPFGHAPRYAVYLRDNFDRQHPTLTLFAGGIPARGLADAVLAAVRRYSAEESAPSPPADPVPVSTIATYCCSECGAEYSPLYGDPRGGIEAGTRFEELPMTWRCPTCEAPQSAYVILRGSAA